MEIKIKCEGAFIVDWHKLVPFQDDLVYSTEEEIEALKTRIIKKGFDNPINVWENKGVYYTLDGHRRREVFVRLEEEGYEIPLIPVNYVHADNEKDAKERILGFRSQFGHVTQEGFEEFVQIAEIEVDPDLVRIDNIEIDTGIEIEEEEVTEPDEEIDEEEVKEYVKEGDVISLGSHKVYCSGAEKEESYKKLFGEKKAGLVVTSPPYNQGEGNYSYDYYNSVKKQSLYKGKSKDNYSKREYKNFLTTVLKNIKTITDPETTVLWNVSYNAKSRDDYGKIVFSNQNPFTVKETIIWTKSASFAIAGEGILSRNSEFIFLMSSGKKYKTNQKKGEDSVYWNTWKINNQGAQIKGKIEACFPVKIPETAIKRFSTSNKDIIFDSFMGSGTTIIAAENTGRKAYGLEINPKNCDIIIYRYCKYKQLKGEIPKIKINNKPVKIAYDFKEEANE